MKHTAQNKYKKYKKNTAKKKYKKHKKHTAKKVNSTTYRPNVYTCTPTCI